MCAMQLLFKLSAMYKPIKGVHMNPSTIIVDEYEQVRRDRESQRICDYCQNSIPIRLMNSHIKVCQFAVEPQDIQNSQRIQIGINGRKLDSSRFSERNSKNKKQKSLKGQCKFVRDTQSQLSAKKIKPEKVFENNEGSSRLGSSKNLRSQSRKPSLSKHKNLKQAKVNKIVEGRRMMESQTPQTAFRNNKSMVGQEYKEYFGGIGKKKAASKMKKDLKSAWVQQTHKNRTQYEENERKRQEQVIQKQKIKKQQNENEKLKLQREQRIRELLRERKKETKKSVRQASHMKRQQKKRQLRQPSNNRQSSRNKNRPAPPRSRNQQPGRNASRQSSRNQRRQPTVEQSYYEQIQMNHPHQTLNFISQTINDQFEMMKEQFENMSQFFSNFVPFSNNAFVYIERNEDSDSSLDSQEEAEEHQGLDEEQIEKLPRYKYSKRSGTEDQCTVCLSCIRNAEYVRRLPCLHIFHSECIDEWLNKKADCPICRQQIN